MPIWHDKAGNAVASPLAPLTDNGLVFQDLNTTPPGGQSELFQTNLIMPEPCEFINKSLPACSIIRPTQRKNAGPLAVVAFLNAMNLFEGQLNPEFFKTLNRLAREADNARRQLGGQDEEDEF